MRPLLVYDGYATGGARAYSMGVSSYTQIGDIIGSNDNGTIGGVSVGDERSLRGDEICQIQNTIYVLHNRTVKKLNSDGSWSTVFSLTSPYTTDDLFNRMTSCVIDGVTYIVVMYASSSSTTSSAYTRAAIYNVNTGTLTTTGELALGSGNGFYAPGGMGTHRLFYFNGIVYGIACATTTGEYIIKINVTSATISKTTFASSTVGDHCRAYMCVFNNELWMLATNGTGASANYILYKEIGGAFVAQYTVATLTVSNTTQGWKPLLFTDGTYMYAICQSEVSSATTWKMYRCTTTSASDITSSVMSGFSGQSRDSRWEFVVDQHSNPQNPDYILIYRSGYLQGSTNTFYRFTDSSTQLQYLGQSGEGGLPASIAIPAMGGGEKMFRNGELHIAFEGPPTMADNPGNMTVYFRIFESSLFPSGYPVNVKMFVTDGLGVPTQPCRLANPQPSGTISNSYTLTGIEAGSGTLYSVDWRAVADGYTAGDPVTMVASVSGVI